MRLALAVIVIAFAAGAENWPQWRGPGSNGVSKETGLPVEWSAEKNVAWKTALPGRGLSSPVVWGGKVFVTAAVEGAVIAGAKPPVHKIEGEVFRHPDSTGADKSYQLLLLCLDAATGKLLWQRTAYEGGVSDERHKKNSYATPTPVVDGKRVFVSFESQGIYAFDFDGKQLWKAALGPILTVGMGPGSSPLLVGDKLILLFDQEEGAGSFIAALDAATGKQVWRTQRDQPANWTTPHLVDAAGKPTVVVTGMKAVIAYDPAGGRELWRTKGMEGNAVPSSVSGLGMVFPSTGYPAKHVYALRLDDAGERLVWQYDKGTAYVPSPILLGDYLYVMTDRGLLTCLEARTGKVVYEGKRVPKPATFSASPVAFEGKLLLTSEEGETFVIRAGPEHEVLHANPLGEPVYASPAVSGGKIFLRGDHHLFAIGKP
jgi:outer membrane protein assembly factor BamB